MVGAFEAAGVKTVLLKGPSIARWLYTDGTSRPYGDSDLLVAPQSLDAVVRILAELGYHSVEKGRRPSERTVHASSYVRSVGAAPGIVDLHTSLALVPASPGFVWEVLTRQTERLTVAGVAVETLDARGRCLHLALHAAQHGVHEAKPLEDLRRGLSQVSRGNWEAAALLADELNCRAPFDLGLAMAEVSGVASLLEHRAWHAAPPALRSQVVGQDVRGSSSVNRLLDLPWPRRLLFGIRHVFASRALIDATQPGSRQRPLLLAWLRRLGDVALGLPAAWRSARRVRRDRPSR